jgi:hypothetical protein
VGAIDRSCESFLDEKWYQSSMIDMSMREDEGIEFLGFNREKSICLVRFLAMSLKHTAVEEICLTVHTEEMLGARDCLRCADEFELHMGEVKCSMLNVKC